MLAHNLARELQMATRPADRTTLPKRTPRWRFRALGTLRQFFLHRAGTISEPQGKLKMTMNPNDAVRREITGYLGGLGVQLKSA